MSVYFSKRAARAIAATVPFAFASTAFAQGSSATAIPSGTLASKPATSGSNDVVKSGFAASSARAAGDAGDVTHATDVSLAAGGLFSAGNAQAMALTSVGKLRLRRSAHQYAAQAAGNFARTGKAGESMETSVENLQGLVRYDYFLSKSFSGFLQTSGRRDRFQGLDLRWNVDPGVSQYLVHSTTQALNLELGYDFQHDIRRDAARVQKDSSERLAKTQSLHNARLFLGYDGKLTPDVGLASGFELLQNVQELSTYRFVFDVGLKSSIGRGFAVATTFTLRYENKPLPGVEPTDSIASVNLVYSRSSSSSQ